MSTVKKPLALIFDFDGVIALSEDTHKRAWEDAGREFGRPIPEGFVDSGVGKHDAGMARELGEAWGGQWPAEAILDVKRRHYRRRSIDEIRLADGVEDALPVWSEIYPIGLATISRREDIDPVLNRGDLARHFASIMTIDDIERPKPDPEIYLASAARLGVEPEACWVFEDSRAGVASACAAGCGVVGLLTTHGAADLQGVGTCFRDFREWRLMERFFLREQARRIGALGVAAQ